MVCTLSSCGQQSPDERFVREKIPIEIQKGKVVAFDIQTLSGAGVNDVGVRCSPDVWKVLTNDIRHITVRLKSSDKKSTVIGGINPEGGGTAFLGYLPDVHYLFYISGERQAKAAVEIDFPNAPTKIVRAEIIVCKTPADTE